MKQSDPKKYVDFDPKLGYPRSPHLYYECTLCSSILPSMPKDNIWCNCYNLMIDVEAGRLAVKDGTKIKLFSKN